MFSAWWRRRIPEAQLGKLKMRQEFCLVRSFLYKGLARKSCISDGITRQYATYLQVTDQVKQSFPFPRFRCFKIHIWFYDNQITQMRKMPRGDLRTGLAFVRVLAPATMFLPLLLLKVSSSFRQKLSAKISPCPDFILYFWKSFLNWPVSLVVNTS